MLWPCLLTLSGFALAFVPVLFGLPDVWPYVPEGLLVAGAAWAVVAWVRDRTRARAIGAGLIVLAAVLHLAWYFWLSTYGRPNAAPDVGVPAPAVQGVRVRDEAKFDLRAQVGRSLLLVFFRGPW